MPTPNRTGKTSITDSQQDVLNSSFDKDFGVLAVEALGYNPTASDLRRISVNADGSIISGTTLDSFKINNLDDGSTAANVLYIGTAKDDGTWCIKKFDETSSTLPTMTYATVTNNVSTTTYATAWTNRATLTYGYYHEAF